MNESEHLYYYASDDGQSTGPVSAQDLRRLLKEGVIRKSTNVFRKGDTQWRRLSDVLPVQEENQADPSDAKGQEPPDKIYYYASDDGQSTGPVSAQDLRRLLKEGVIRKSTSVFRKGDAQWKRLSDVLPVQDSSDSPASPEREIKKFHSLAKGEVSRNFLSILMDTYVIALKNFFPVLLAVILWSFTCWIPYINIGTTVAIQNLPVDLARGKIISPTLIFARRYRQFFGELYLLNAFMLIGIAVCLVPFIFPAIILSYAWMLAPILLIDKGVNPMEALTLSNKYTYGNKFSYFLVSIALFISLAILFGLISLISPELGMITSILLTPVTGASLIAAVYKRLVLSQINEA